MPEECMKEMTVSTQYVMVTSSNSHGIGKIMDATNFNTLGKLMRVTAYIVRFSKTLKAKIQQQELKTPATLEAILIVKSTHSRVIHNGVKETLTEIRCKYWII